MAERLTLHLFKQDSSSLINFSDDLRSLTVLRSCANCFHISEGELCGICLDQSRDRKILCIVEEPMDVMAIERTGSYRGMYHVLGGTLETSSRRQKERPLHIEELLTRIRESEWAEIVLALNPTAEGDLTALYLRRKLEGTSAIVSRLGRGLSMGGDIEYTDEITLGSAISRRERIS